MKALFSPYYCPFNISSLDLYALGTLNKENVVAEGFKNGELHSTII